MRRKYSNQNRFDCPNVVDVKLNLNCRDEIIPILRALQHVYSQHEHLLKKVKQIARKISRISSRKGAKYEARLKKQYRILLKRTEKILKRAKELCKTLKNRANKSVLVIGQVVN